MGYWNFNSLIDSNLLKQYAQPAVIYQAVLSYLWINAWNKKETPNINGTVSNGSSGAQDGYLSGVSMRFGWWLANSVPQCENLQKTYLFTLDKLLSLLCPVCRIQCDFALLWLWIDCPCILLALKDSNFLFISSNHEEFFSATGIHNSIHPFCHHTAYTEATGCQ